MKSILTSLLGLFLVSFLFSGCLKDSCSEKKTYTIYSPVYKEASALREGIAVEAPRPLKKPGKIYSYGQFLLINEIKEGVHIIDNSDPAAPVNLAFLAIPGNADMAVYDKVLYADNYMDLVAFDIREITKPALVHRIENVFQTYNQTELGVIIDYTETQETITADCNSGNFFWLEDGDLAFESSLSNSSDISQATGIGGSLARFTIAANHLYAVDRTNLLVFGLAQPSAPLLAGNNAIGWNIETIFPYKNYLFVGSETGLYIFDNTVPAVPVQLSYFEHARACDPVVTDGDYAYVTLRDGTECLGFINQLDVVDIKNLLQPKLLKSFPMTHPIGLAVRGNYLYLCDDQAGLRIFDKTDPLQLGAHQVGHVQGARTYDVIALPGSTRLLVIGPDGFTQYDAADPANPVVLSTIPVQQ
ncbi:MAG: hypothetical protein KA479_05720 [Saprospiraceae bacterium]|nr:hypothetical protein [Saprospiraceae bacterium]